MRARRVTRTLNYNWKEGMEPNSNKEYCDNCHGSGLVLEAPRDGYHIYRQCHVCRGAGYIKEIT